MPAPLQSAVATSPAAMLHPLLPSVIVAGKIIGVAEAAAMTERMG